MVVNGNFFFSDNVDASDLKQFFETNYSQIYFIFYENFITLENSLKLKGKNFYKKIFFLYTKFCFFFFFFFLIKIQEVLEGWVCHVLQVTCL